jgi:hypothetical protein
MSLITPLFVICVVTAFDFLGLLDMKSISVHRKQWLGLIALSFILATLLDLPVLIGLRAKRMLALFNVAFAGALLAGIPLIVLLLGGSGPLGLQTLVVLFDTMIVGGLFNSGVWFIALKNNPIWAEK